MSVIDEIQAHAARAAPGECCGLVVETSGGLQYVPATNLATESDRFDLDPVDWIRAGTLGEIRALVHSHPEGPAVLSSPDRYYQRATDLDWWLATPAGVRVFRNVPPLLGRVWDHGRLDCLSIILDAYHLSGLELGEYDREDGWWDGDQDLYLEHLPAAGFERLGPDDPLQLGDVVTVCLGSTKANHGALYLGDGYLLHHCPKRLSKRDMYGGYWQRQTHSVWRHTQWQQCDFTGILNDLAASTAFR